MNKQIFKIQMPLGGEMGDALVYNKNKDILFHLKLDNAIIALMDGEEKEFVYGDFRKKNGGGFQITGFSEWQDW